MVEGGSDPLSDRISLKIRTSSGTSDDLCYLLFEIIPIASIDFLDLRIEVLRNVHELLPIRFGANKGDGNANTAKSTSSTNTVKIGLRICNKRPARSREHIWNIVVDDHRDRGHINTAGEDVSGNKDFGMTESEGINDDITLLAFETAG